LNGPPRGGAIKIIITMIIILKCVTQNHIITTLHNRLFAAVYHSDISSTVISRSPQPSGRGPWRARCVPPRIMTIRVCSLFALSSFCPSFLVVILTQSGESRPRSRVCTYSEHNNNIITSLIGTLCMHSDEHYRGIIVCSYILILYYYYYCSVFVPRRDRIEKRKNIKSSVW